MSVNSSSNSSLYFPVKSCFSSRSTISTLTALFVTYILFVLPIFTLVLYVGYQRWRKQHSSSQAVKNSHSDIFTFNMVMIDLVSIFGFSLYCYGIYTNVLYLVSLGLYTLAVISPGQTLFHLLTCVDRYLAVVHPVIYLGLKQSDGVRIRNVIIGCVWLLCIASLSQIFTLNFYIGSNMVLMCFSFVVVSFCSVSVLCVLIHPGPGDMAGKRGRVDQSKLRVFYTIMAITGALLSRFLTILAFVAVLTPSVRRLIDYCLVMSASSWLSLPSGLVLPLLFLQRAGKLPGSKQTSKSV